jgi:type VI secretion system protein VasG
MKTLISKFNKISKTALEKGAELCVSKSHFTVEIEHFLLKLLDQEGTDLRLILKYYEVEAAQLKQQLEHAIEGLKRGSNRTPSLSPHLMKLAENAWMLSSIELNHPQIRSGTLLQSLLSTEELRGIILEHCPILLKISRGKLEEDLPEILKASAEEIDYPYEAGQMAPKNPKGGNEALDRFTVDLIEQAHQGKIDPVEGRDKEIRQMIDILTRRRQNNPILTGDAGVGKTAVVEGLALKIAQGDVPPALKNVSIRSLDLGLLEAGAGVKGEFEHRLKSVIEEVQGSLTPVILFIDEAHRLIGAGGEQQNDAANLLKPALARGELKTIAATTWDEYKKYFEKDAALSRRFQVVKIEEPSENIAIHMLRTLVEKLENHHKVTILNEALASAVRFSHRYIPGRKLPDKAVSVLDTACARVGVSQTTMPEDVVDLKRRIDLLTLEQSMLEKESVEGVNHKERLQEIDTEVKILHKDLKTLEKKWQDELAFVQTILKRQEQLRHLLKAGNADESQLTALKQELGSLKEQLKTLSKSGTLVPLCVDEEIIAAVISDWTGIPAGKMLRDEITTVLSLQETLSKRLIGQSQALKTITEHVWTYRAHLGEPGKPVGVFLLVGPSGVGKTETALALADALYGGERNLITVNMSEYQEAYTISTLRGSPPGYVGHGKGGILTEAIRRNPYSVVLLDEVEKAHPDVMELFYQTFDKGVMEDGEGIEVDFKNTLILLTSNLGSSEIMHLCKNEEAYPDSDMLEKALWPILSHHFKPAFLGRMTMVPYYPLTRDQIQQVIRLKLDKIKKRYEAQHKAAFHYDQHVVNMVADKCTQSDTGARMIDHVLSQNLLPLLAAQILKRISEDLPPADVEIYVNDKEEFVCTFKTKHAA